MSRTCIPFSTSDISAFARSLHNQLEQANGLPGHLELLNMLARAAGYRNYQSLRAQSAARDLLEAPPPQPEPVNLPQVQSALRHFDQRGRLLSWPAKPGVRAACLWVLWASLPAGRALTENELNQFIRAGHLFGDHALLRRELCDARLLRRTPDGRLYWRVEQPPTPEGLHLIRRFAGAGQAAPAGARRGSGRDQ